MKKKKERKKEKEKRKKINHQQRRRKKKKPVNLFNNSRIRLSVKFTMLGGTSRGERGGGGGR